MNIENVAKIKRIDRMWTRYWHYFDKEWMQIAQNGMSKNSEHENSNKGS